MKLKFEVIGLAIALCAPLRASAQPVAANPPSSERHELREGPYHLGKLERASRIIGMEIKDPYGEKLGHVKDLAIDLHDGRILEVIVGVGGFLGVEERFFAVPPSKFTCDAARKMLVLNVDKSRFKTAPAFKLSDWDSSVRDGSVHVIYQYYGVKPYFNATSNPVGDVRRANRLMGTMTHNEQDEKLGKIENLIIDLRAGRVIEVILASGGFLGLGHELSAVPPQPFHPGIHGETLLLNTTRAALFSAPRFRESAWPNFDDPRQPESVYRAYHVEPSFSTSAAEKTTEDVRDRVQ